MSTGGPSNAMASSTHLNLAFVACVPIVIGEILLATGRVGVIVPILILIAGAALWAFIAWRSVGYIRAGRQPFRTVGISAVIILVIVPVAGYLLSRLLVHS